MFTRANAWTLSQNRRFPLAWYTDLFTHSSTRNNLHNRHTASWKQLPNYKQMYWQSIDVLSTNSLEKLNVLHQVNLLPSLHTCVFIDESSCLSVFGGRFLSRRVQTVAVHAFAVAVHADPHVTPAANPPAVQFSQADDMQKGIPLSCPSRSLIGSLWLGWALPPGP